MQTIQFDKKYFDGIWSTSHPHNDCKYLTSTLTQKYGQTRFLDTGTGYIMKGKI